MEWRLLSARLFCLSNQTVARKFSTESSQGNCQGDSLLQVCASLFYNLRDPDVAIIQFVLIKGRRLPSLEIKGSALELPRDPLEIPVVNLAARELKKLVLVDRHPGVVLPDLHHPEEK